jgi:hypothetical protein
VSAASGKDIGSKKWLVDQPVSCKIELWETDSRRDTSGERQGAKSPHHGRDSVLVLIGLVEMEIFWLMALLC